MEHTMGLGKNITIASLHCCRNCEGIRGSLGIRGLLRKVTEHFYPCQPPLSTTKRPCTVRGRSQEASHSSYWSTLLAHGMCFQKTKSTLFFSEKHSIRFAFWRNCENMSKVQGWLKPETTRYRSISIFRNPTPAVENQPKLHFSPRQAESTVSTWTRHF